MENVSSLPPKTAVTLLKTPARQIWLGCAGLFRGCTGVENAFNLPCIPKSTGASGLEGGHKVLAAPPAPPCNLISSGDQGLFEGG